MPHAAVCGHPRARDERRATLHDKLLRNLLGVGSATLHGVNTEIAHLTR